MVKIEYWKEKAIILFNHYKREHNIDCNLTFEKLNGEAGVYRYGTNTVCLDLENIITKTKEKGYNTANYLSYVIAHELGHYFDYKFNKSRVKLRGKIKSELAAWLYGRKLIEPIKIKEYDLFNRKNYQYQMFLIKHEF